VIAALLGVHASWGLRARPPLSATSLRAVLLTLPGRRVDSANFVEFPYQTLVSMANDRKLGKEIDWHNCLTFFDDAYQPAYRTVGCLRNSPKSQSEAWLFRRRAMAPGHIQCNQTFFSGFKG